MSIAVDCCPDLTLPGCCCTLHRPLLQVLKFIFQGYQKPSYTPFYLSLLKNETEMNMYFMLVFWYCCTSAPELVLLNLMATKTQLGQLSVRRNSTTSCLFLLPYH